MGDRATFAALRRRGRRAAHGPVWVRHLDDGRPARVAYALGRSLGNAVTRNRVRRRLRAVVADLERGDALPQGAWLIGASPAVTERTFEDLTVDVRSAMRRLGSA